MTNSLTGLLGSAPRDFTLTTRYRANIDTLRGYFKQHPQTELITIPAEEAYLYRGDLTGLLLARGIPLEDHYLIMRVNELTSIHSIEAETITLTVPSPDTINQFKKNYLQGIKK